MKKILLSVIVLIPLISLAQQGFQFGVVGGPQASWLFNSNDRNNPSIEYQSRFNQGFVGPTIDFHFTDGLGIGVEGLFSVQGQEYGNGSIVLKRDVDYVRIPLVLNFNSSPRNVIMLIGKIGPEFNVLTSANQIDQADPNGVNVKSDFNNLNVGAVAALGFGINIKRVMVLSVDGRIDAGLTDAVVSNPNEAYFSGAPRGKTWDFAAGLEFGLKFIIPTGR